MLVAQTLPFPPAFAQTTSQASLQQQFNAATEAWQKGDCAAALPLFETVAKDSRIKPGSLPAAAVAVRRGSCLIRTGREEEGEAILAAGLPVLATKGAEFSSEIAQGEMQLGMLAQGRWDHDAALKHYRAALAQQQDKERLPALMRIARVTAFDKGSEGLDAIAEGEALVAADPQAPKGDRAVWNILRGRILLNRGQVKEGRSELNKALTLTGGYKDKISLSDAVLRQDLAQAAMLAQDKETAYKFMGMSGAGRVANSPFAKAAEMVLPPCGEETGLKPEDSAVVEFGIDQQGAVTAVDTIWSTTDYARAAAFARAVSQWRWKPEDAARLPSFFRAASRVELRCTNTAGDEGGSLFVPISQRLSEWSAKQPWNKVKRATGGKWGGEEMLRAAEEAASTNDPVLELAARLHLATTDLRAKPVALQSVDRALILAQTAQGVPDDIRSAARVLLTARRQEFEPAPRRFGAARRKGNPGLLALAEEPAIKADPLALDTAILGGLPALPSTEEEARTTEGLRAVANDTRLGEHHPLRQYAQLRLANQAASQGDLAKARQWFEATGLSEEQCALIGPKPALTNNPASSENFPWAALMWGFEGWVRTEFDIKVNGRTASVRPLVAYPPFIFNEASTGIAGGARYQSSFRPEGAMACSAHQEQIRFVIPGNQNVTHEVKPKKPARKAP